MLYGFKGDKEVSDLWVKYLALYAWYENNWEGLENYNIVGSIVDAFVIGVCPLKALFASDLRTIINNICNTFK